MYSPAISRCGSHRTRVAAPQEVGRNGHTGGWWESLWQWHGITKPQHDPGGGAGSSNMGVRAKKAKFPPEQIAPGRHIAFCLYGQVRTWVFICAPTPVWGKTFLKKKGNRCLYGWTLLLNDWVWMFFFFNINNDIIYSYSTISEWRSALCNP